MYIGSRLLTAPQGSNQHTFVLWSVCDLIDYSKVEFFVYNVYRWYHGYFDGNPANLLPRPISEVNNEIMDLIGDEELVLGRVGNLMEAGKTQLALQVLDVLLQARPEHVKARRLRIELLETLGAEDTCLMSVNAWVYFIEKDRAFLESLEHPGSSDQVRQTIRM